MRASLLITSFLAPCVLLAAAPAQSQQGYVYVRIDGQTACQVDLSAGIHTASVVVVNAQPFQGVEFRAPVPAGVQYLGDQSDYLSIGNSQTGVQVGTGCQASVPFELLRIVFFVPAPLNDVHWSVESYPGQTSIRLADCSGRWMTGSNAYSIYCDEGFMIGPYAPNPPDGATNVPLDVALSFVGAATEVGVADHPMEWPYEGNVFYCDSSPYPPGNPPCDLPLDPGPLLPNTTYYWRSVNACCCCEHGEFGAGDVWSFTTGEAPLSVNKTTWGQVKAMYRE